MKIVVSLRLNGRAVGPPVSVEGTSLEDLANSMLRLRVKDDFGYVQKQGDYLDVVVGVIKTDDLPPLQNQN